MRKRNKGHGELAVIISISIIVILLMIIHSTKTHDIEQISENMYKVPYSEIEDFGKKHDIVSITPINSQYAGVGYYVIVQEDKEPQGTESE